MKIKEFDRLNDAEKQHEVWKYGIFLKNLCFGSKVFDVYRLFDFYVSQSFSIEFTPTFEIHCHIYPEKLPLVKTVYYSI